MKNWFGMSVTNLKLLKAITLRRQLVLHIAEINLTENSQKIIKTNIKDP